MRTTMPPVTAEPKLEPMSLRSVCTAGSVSSGA
jgi:hypothetical protein